MEEKKFTYSQKISGLLASLTAFVCSAIIFLRTQGNMTLNTLLYSLGIIVSGSVVVGLLGHYIGKIIEGSKKKKKKLNKFMR